MKIAIGNQIFLGRNKVGRFVPKKKLTYLENPDNPLTVTQKSVKRYNIHGFRIVGTYFGLLNIKIIFTFHKNQYNLNLSKPKTYTNLNLPTYPKLTNLT